MSRRRRPRWRWIVVLTIVTVSAAAWLYLRPAPSGLPIPGRKAADAPHERITDDERQRLQDILDERRK